MFRAAVKADSIAADGMGARALKIPKCLKSFVSGGGLSRRKINGDC